MNFVGKFDAQLPADGLAGHAHVQTYSPTAHAPADAIIVPDAHLLFGADFKRSGVDLILSNADRELVVHDYFKGEHRHPLASPDGAHLTGDIVNALTGQVEYAQAAAPDAAAHVIGHVTKLSGSATAIRNGVSVILNNGDNVEKGDVVATGSDSTLGVTFIDGTVFGLASNARMVLNEMVYDPNGSNNSSLISLVAGTISFVAGETAKHGDMKVDTPVATMGIRGTAVLVEIDFNVPGQNGLPDAKFQVLVEPDGHTGSYILFDKTTLDPIATVNKAGQQVNINQNGISYTNSPLSPELQKLISDVFSQKFTDLNNSNTKTFDHFTDSIVPQTLQPIKGLDGIIATPVVLVVTPQGSGTPPPSAPTNSTQHIDQPPAVVTTPGLFGELKDITGSHTPDIASGTINFVDINAGDQPTASTKFDSVVYQNAQHQDISKSLTPTELAAVQAVEVALNVVQDPADKNNGSATWTYTVPDGALDFLGAGETLTLTYLASVSNNYAPNIEITTVPITITITGTNDVPVITSAVPQTIAFYSGTSVPGGDLTTKVATSGAISFDDPDLTDIHTVSVSTPTSTLTDPTTGKTIAFTLPPTPQALFDQALTASLTDPTTGLSTDSTGTGLGTISWNLADLPVWLGDYIPKGDTLTLTYVVTVTDSQGATAQQDITVTITGTDAPAEVWVATTGTGPAPDGLWSTGTNWETGNAPTASDDAIIITDQLEGLTPTYPVTITSAAEAHSLKMDNYGGAAPVLINQSTLAIGTDFNINDHSTDNPDGYTGPELDNQGTLTVGGAFNLNADSIVDNSGTITVDGEMEVLDQSTVENSGTIKLAGGGDFSDESTISNTTADAIMEVSGGTLNVGVDISNQGTVKVDSTATLTLDSATIDGGTVTVSKNGTLTLNGGAVVKNGTLGNAGQISASGDGNALDNEQITNTGGIEIAALGALTLDLLTEVANTNHTITVDSTGMLTLQGGASVTGGSLSNSGMVDIEGTGATLDGVTITGSGAVNVDAASALTTTLVLKDITSITDGTLTVGPTGILSVAGNVTLDHVGVTNQNSVEVTAGNALTLDHATTLDNAAGTVTIDGTGKLALNDAEITGGVIVDNGTIDITGSSTIDGNAALNGGNVTVEADQTLTLDNVTVTGTSFDDSASGATIQLDDGTTLTLSGATIDGGAITDNGTIDVTGSSTIDGNAALNGGNVTIEANQILTLDDVTVTDTSFDDTASGATVQVDGATGDTLKLSGVSVTGGGFNVAAHGLVQTSGDITLTNASVTNDGTIEVTGGKLTITGTGSAADSVANDGGTIQIDGGAVLDLNVPDTQNVSFTGTDGKLQIDTGSFGGSIVGLAATDQIDLTTIGYGPGTTATYVSNAGNTGGTLTVTDGSHSIALQLVGDYTNAHFAGSDDGNHDLLITLNANDDAPVFASGETAQTATVAELTDVTGSPAVDDSTPAGGAIHFTDIDLTDRPTATVTLQAVMWTGGTLTDAEASALESGFQLTPVTNTNNGEIDWTYSITDGSLDFLGAGQTATVTSTVTLDDHQGGTSTATVTVTIDGANDIPTITATSGGITEAPNVTGSGATDTATGTIAFTDADSTDRPTVSTSFVSAKYTDAAGDDLTQMPGLQAAVAALETALTLAPGNANANNGSVGWTYSVTDSALDFMAAGDKLILTYDATVTDHNGGTATTPVTVTITGSDDAPVISGTTTGTVADGGVSVTSGVLNAADPDRGDTVTWSVVGGTSVAPENYSYGLEELKVVKGANNTTIFDDSFTGTAPPAGPNFLVNPVQSGVVYAVSGGTFAVGATATQIEGANAAPVGINLGSSGHGDIVFGQYATLLTGTSFDAPSGVGLRSGDSFSAQALFDLDNPVDSTTHYGIRLSDRVSGSVGGINDQPGTETVDLDVVHNADGSMSVELNQIDFETGAATHLQTIQIHTGLTPGITDNEILLNLSNAAATNGHVTASFQLMGTNSDGAEVADGGPVAFTATGQIFDHEDWTRVQVYGQSVGTSDTAPVDVTANAVSVLQGSYGTLDVNGTTGAWQYFLDPGLASVKALAAGQTAVDSFTIAATDSTGAQTDKIVNVTVTGSNDAPTIAGETNPATQTVILGPTGPTVLSAGTTTNALGLPTETFDGQGIKAGDASNNGAGFGDFTSTALGATFSGSGHAGVVNGSSSASAAPFIGPLPGQADTTNYLSIGAGGSETITFATEQNQFGLYWGSADSYNTISFYDGGELVATYSGADVAPLLANGGQGSFSSNGYVEFSDLAPFTTVVLTSSSNAFEIDNISAGDSHVHLAGPITGTLTVNDADIGDTLTASVAGNAVAEYNGSTTLPSGVDVSALIASGAITFDTVKTTGGQDVLDWTYNPANANLDFLRPGDTLTLTFNATVSDGHATTASQALTITLVGNGAPVVNGTAQNDTFTDVGGGVTISGNGGHDVYNFNAHFGSATISDFDVGNDVIDISSTSFSSVTALLNSAVTAGANAVITDSTGDTIALDNVSVAQLKAHPGDFQFTIANGGTFEAGASTSENVVFEGSTGKLTVDTPSSFSGVISGFTGDGTPAGSDQIDLKGIDHNSSSFTESFNAANDSLFVSDGAHSTTLYFNGVYQAQNFSFTTDDNGGTIVYDPPVGGSAPPGPDTATQAVTATGHGFLFDFIDNAHDANGAFSTADTHRLEGQTFVNADPDKPHDDGHGQMTPVPDSMDAGTSAVVKALLHAHDFHFV